MRSMKAEKETMADEQDRVAELAKGDPDYRRMLMEDAVIASRQEDETTPKLTPMREALGYLDKISPAGWHVERARDVLIAAIADGDPYEPVVALGRRVRMEWGSDVASWGVTKGIGWDKAERSYIVTIVREDADLDESAECVGGPLAGVALPLRSAYKRIRLDGAEAGEYRRTQVDVGRWAYMWVSR